MDFDYPYDEPACEKIYIPSGQSRHQRIEINPVGNDIIIEIVVKRRTETTIILKDAVLNGVTVDESTFIYAWPDWGDCSRYWCF